MSRGNMLKAIGAGLLLLFLFFHPAILFGLIIGFLAAYYFLARKA